MIRIRPFTAIALALAASLSAQDQKPPIRSPLAELLPALDAQSTWGQDARYEGVKPDKRTRGVFPVGNGIVFAYAGLGARANTLQAITGPGYQTAVAWAPKGHFGEISCELTAGGQLVDLPLQRVRRVKGANFVVTEDANEDGLALRTLSFAAPGSAQLTRIVQVTAGRSAASGLGLRVAVEGPATIAGNDLTAVYDQGARTRNLRVSLAKGEAMDGALHATIGDLPAGQSWSSVLALGTGMGKDGAKADVQLLNAGAAADATFKHWQQTLARTTYFDTDHQKLRDLFEDWKVLLLVQRDQQSGVVAPMVNYRGLFVRDSVGPMLLFLRFNMWEEAATLLRFLFDATRVLGRVPDQVPLDLDLTALQGKTTDWTQIQVQDSEVPSWVILLHFWYWRATQDTKLIEAHWPLLDVCLKRQRRDPDGSLMFFHGGETQLHGAYAALFPQQLGERAFLIADAEAAGRRAFSFASGVMFLIAYQAVGELLDGIDREKRPQAWENEKPNDRPGQRYVEHTFKIMQEIEKKYWLEDLQYFAPAVSPVSRTPHRAPFADFNLTPLWVGWTFPTGERSRDNLRNSLARLAWRGGRVGTTPTSMYTTGLTQAMLLTALCERDAKERQAAFDEVLQLAGPGGEWGELYDEDGRPIAAHDPEWPNRLRPWESGVNLDALMFAITGIRYVSVPNWDNSDIRLELRMPNGTRHVTLKDQKKDGRHLQIFMKEAFAKLTEEERKQNEQKKPEERRDPNAEYRRLEFRVEQLSPNPKKGYYDVGCNAMGTMFVRYLWKETPIREIEFWTEDKEIFLPDPKAEALPLPWTRLQKASDAELLVFSKRGLCAELAGSDKTTFVDTGLPWTPQDLAGLLVGPEGKPTHARLLLDWGWNATDRSTMKTAAFWSDKALTQALAAYRNAGGQVLDPGYVVVEESGKGGAVVQLTIASDAEREVVLRVGAGCTLAVTLAEKEVYTSLAPRTPLPDLGSVLIRLRAGDNRLVLTLRNDGTQRAYVRCSDARGLPVAGVSIRR